MRPKGSTVVSTKEGRVEVTTDKMRVYVTISPTEGKDIEKERGLSNIHQ